MKDILWGIVIIFILVGLFSGCTNTNTVSNDWDADGDSFDSDDYNKFIEYKSSQDNNDW